LSFLDDKPKNFDRSAYTDLFAVTAVGTMRAGSITGTFCPHCSPVEKITHCVQCAFILRAAFSILYNGDGSEKRPFFIE